MLIGMFVYHRELVGQSMIHILVEEIRATMRTLNSKGSKCSNILPPSSPHEPIEDCPDIMSGEEIIDRKSVFQAHVAQITSPSQVSLVLAELKKNRKIQKAKHNMFAYVVNMPDGKKIVREYDDDGENRGGQQLLKLLEVLIELGRLLSYDILSEFINGFICL